MHHAPGQTAEFMPLARVHGAGDVRLDPVPRPVIGPDDALVAVAACGICGSDLGYIAQGGLGGTEPLSAPIPIGHEFAGRVVAVGDAVVDIRPGLRVAVNPDRAYIGGGGPDGAMAPFIRVSGAELSETLFPLPNGLDFVQASLAEPLSVALHGLRLAGVTARDKVAIIGAGPIGLCALVMLIHLGAKDIAIFDRVPERLQRAKELGAGLAVNIADEPMEAALTRFHGAGKRFGRAHVGTDVFVDCAGSVPALEAALHVAKYRARVAVIALHHAPLQLDLFHLMANEIALFGSIADARAAEFGEAITMLASGQQDLAPLISHTFPFSRFAEALATAGDPQRAAKVVLTFDEAA